MNTEKYRVIHDKPINLGKFSTRAPKDFEKDITKKELTPENLEVLKVLQEKLYAENQRGIVIVLQAMDAAGKDGIIKHVLTALNPQGTPVKAFKQPSNEELDHDYLWRINKALPARGEIGIFNRSHYEDVIVTRVHNLLEKSNLPEELIEDDVWKKRYRQINDFEKYLYENGFEVLKFFLHVSKEEQRLRLLDRVERPDKHWKFSYSDIEERKYFEKYMKTYESVLKNTSTEYAPWYILPADQKWFSRFLISEILRQKLEKMNPEFPKLSKEEESQLEEARKILKAEE